MLASRLVRNDVTTRRAVGSVKYYCSVGPNTRETPTPPMPAG
jgi:hypothetical protein